MSKLRLRRMHLKPAFMEQLGSFAALQNWWIGLWPTRDPMPCGAAGDFCRCGGFVFTFHYPSDHKKVAEVDFSDLRYAPVMGTA